MGLAETQNVLARLYTDPGLRARFFAAPVEVGRELGLDSGEARQLAALPSQEVEAFADSLIGKRLGEVCDLLPLTRRALAEDFARLFRAYATSHVPRGVRKHYADAVSFAAHLEKLPPREVAPGPWVVDLLRYERARLEAAGPQRRLVARAFRYHVGELAGALARGEQILSARRYPTIALWVRLTPRGSVRHFTWPKGRRHAAPDRPERESSAHD